MFQNIIYFIMAPCTPRLAAEGATLVVSTPLLSMPALKGKWGKKARDIEIISSCRINISQDELAPNMCSVDISGPYPPATALAEKLVWNSYSHILKSLTPPPPGDLQHYNLENAKGDLFAVFAAINQSKVPFWKFCFYNKNLHFIVIKLIV